MIRAFFVKDMRLAVRGGALLPGLFLVLAGQAGLFLVLGIWSSANGPPAYFLEEMGTWLAAGSLFGAMFIPFGQSVMAMNQEAPPEVADSLSCAPARPFGFLIGKIGIPVLRACSLQLALLPTWGFLAGRGLIDAGGAARLLMVQLLVVVCSASLGASRYRLLSQAAARPVKTGVMRGAGPASGQQYVALGVIFVVMPQVMMGRVSNPLAAGQASGSLLYRAYDTARLISPFHLLRSDAPISVFGLGVPVWQMTPVLLVVLTAMLLAGAVAAHPRAGISDRIRGQAVSIGARSAALVLLCGLFWVEGPQLACAVAGTAAVLFALFGLAGAENRLTNAKGAALACLLPAAVTGAFAGTSGVLFWAGVAVICATGAAALPVAGSNETRRRMAMQVLVAVGVIAPIVLVSFQAYPGLAWLSNVGAVGTWVSLPAAVTALAHDAMGVVPIWADVKAAAPSLGGLPPWVAAPVFFAAVTAAALWRGKAKGT